MSRGLTGLNRRDLVIPDMDIGMAMALMAIHGGSAFVGRRRRARTDHYPPLDENGYPIVPVPFKPDGPSTSDLSAKHIEENAKLREQHEPHSNREVEAKRQAKLDARKNRKRKK